jgi:membrane-associated phospholipid phosphatase
MIWRHPGFPSLLVTYDVANDFFFSGHTAIAVLGAIVAAGMFPWWAGAAVGLIALGEASVVLILRAHYSMDVFAAVVAAFCAAGLADWLCAAL